MTQDHLLAEVSTSTDADTSRVLVEGGERIVLKIEGDNNIRATFLTRNEASRLSRELAEAAAQAKPKRGGAVIVDGSSDGVVPSNYQQ